MGTVVAGFVIYHYHRWTCDGVRSSGTCKAELRAQLDVITDKINGLMEKKDPHCLRRFVVPGLSLQLLQSLLKF